MLTAGGRRRRVVAATAGISLLLAGTFFGSDDHFPFGPFRMYAEANEPDGRIGSTFMQVRLPGGDWHRVRLDPDTLGLRRAEVEGQLGRFRADPSLLRLLAEARSRRHPDAPPWEGVRLVVRRWQLEDRKPVGEPVDTVVAEWTAQ